MRSRLFPALTLTLAISIAALAAEFFWLPWRIVSRKIDDVRLGDLPAITYALDDYRMSHGNYPATLEQLALDHAPMDPWGTAYIYERSDFNRYVLRSAGANAIDERGEGDDITTWPKRYECASYRVNCLPDLAEIARATPLVTALASVAGQLGLGALAARQRWLRRSSF